MAFLMTVGSIYLCVVLRELGHHAMLGEAVQLMVHVFGGEGHRCSVLGALGGVPRPCHHGTSNVCVCVGGCGVGWRDFSWG